MSKYRVLIVDDERAVADSLGWVFEHRGYECHVSYSGSEALATSRMFSPQLLLCDMTMPGMDGQTTATLIAREVPECRVLMLSGDYAALEEARIAMSPTAGNKAFLTKPIAPVELLDAAQELLQQPMDLSFPRYAVQ
jgi:CheY-like chemotaxis protein